MAITECIKVHSEMNILQVSKLIITKNLWYDFALAEGGSLIDLVMKLHNCSLIQAIELFNGK